MRYVKELSQYSGEGPTAVTFGKFDGLHLGHQKLIDKVLELEKLNNVKSVVCAFDMRPLWKENGITAECIMTGADRYHRLNNKIDYLIECPFTKKVQNITAETFIRDIIHGILRAEYVVVGEDFRFGKNKDGDVNLLRQYSKQYDYKVIVADKVRCNGEVISSTRIRNALKEGNLSLTNYLLGYPFVMNGQVEHGKKLGTRLGFPTMNVEWPEYKIVPPKGVYVSVITIDEERYCGISNVGIRPTVASDERVMVESFLFDYTGDAYGKNVRVELLEFRRPEQKFSSVEEMQEQVHCDILFGKSYFGMRE